MDDYVEEFIKKLGKEDAAMLSPNETAKVLGVPPDLVRSWLRKEIIKGVKVSRSWMIPKDEIKRIFKNKPEQEF